MGQRQNNFNPGSLRKKYLELSKTLQAYQAAVNEVAIVSITDLEGRIIYTNDKFTQISQYTPAELLGKTHRLINSGYHDELFFKEMWQTIRQGNPWRGEIKNKAKDGSFYWVDTIITPIRDKKNHVFQYLSIRNLITVQKEHEEKLISFQKDLLKRKQQLKDAQQVAKTGSWYLDVPGHSLEWSEETYRIFEIPFNQPVTRELFAECVYIDDRELVDVSWAKALITGSYELEHRIVTPSGIKWVSELARLELDAASSITKALGTVQDITEKKKTETILKESELLYRSLFNNSPHSVGIVEKETLRFLEVNETATKLYGYSREEFLELTAYDIRVVEEHNDLTELIQKGVYATNKDIRTHRKKNGDIILIEPTITEINYRGTKAFLITINDVTEKIHIQEELAAEKNKKQQEIIRASLKAEEKSRAAIGRELHDNINQLLAASKLYFGQISSISKKDELYLKRGKDIITEAIEEIRILSSRLVSPSVGKMNLVESIKDLSSGFKMTNTAVKLNIEINEDGMEEPLKLNLYRIVQEQFSNILKYAAASKVIVRMRQTNKKLTLEINDNGKGFDIMQKGSGIGQANIFHRAEAHNGSVTIESSPGKGCNLLIVFS